MKNQRPQRYFYGWSEGAMRVFAIFFWICIALGLFKKLLDYIQGL